jgi:nitrogen fixation/metabolism regulation signal transduction histidine kinase
MRRLFTASVVGAAALAALVWEATPEGAALGVPGRIALLVVTSTALGFAASRRHPGAASPHRGLLFLWLLALAFGLALPFLWRTPQAETWQSAEEARIRARFEVVRARLQGLERTARALGDAVYALVDSAPAGTVEERVHLFQSLSEQVESARRRAPPDVPDIGVQVFDDAGRLLAWAGSVRSERASTRLTRFGPGPRELYFRRTGVFTSMVYDRHDARALAADSLVAPRVLVEVPVRQHERLRNPLLRRWSLGERLSGDGVHVELHYEAFVPPYLSENQIELLGDPVRGLQAEFVVRGEDGIPRVVGRLSGAPREDHVAGAETRRQRAQAWLALTATLLGLLAAAQAWVRSSTARKQPAWHAPGLPLGLIGALGTLRVLAAWLDIPSSASPLAVLDPAAFAVRGFAGVLRSPLDFALSGLTLLISVALLFVDAALRASRRARRPASGSGRRAAAVALAVLVVAGLVGVSLRFIGVVVQNTTATLLGPDANLFSAPVLCIHIGMLTTIAALLSLAFVVVSRLAPAGSARTTWLAGCLILVAALWWQTSPVIAIAGGVVLLGGAGLWTLLSDERFTSFALATLTLVAITATLVAESMHRENFRTRQGEVLERAAQMHRTVDALRPFVLQRVLQDLRDDPQLQHAVGRGGESSGLGFEIWAASMLSRTDWPCQVRVYDEWGRVASEFSIGMPYQRDTPTREIQDRARVEGLRVEQTEVETTPVGRVRLYRGVVPLRRSAPAPPRGAVVIDLPFAHQSLALAANPRARTPELLRAGGGAGPRVDESQRDLLAWVEDGFVTEASTPYLEVGRALDPPGGGESAWSPLQLVNGTYQVTHIGVADRVLVAGFQVRKPFDRLLDWTQVASFDFALALALLLLLVALGRVNRISSRLPPLLVPKRIGFQQKLMGAFLLVALIPSVVLSLAARDIMQDRSVSRNRDTALTKARSAEAALSDLVRREIQTVRESEYLRGVLRQDETPPVRDIGQLEFSQVMVFHGDGRIILDETLSNLSDEEGQRFVTEAPRKVFASRDESGSLNLGALEPLWFSREEGFSETAPDARLYYMYYRRQLTDDLLRDVASILNTDISGFLGPELVVSSRKSLATAGLLPNLVPPAAFMDVQLSNNRYAVVEELAGLQRYFSGYLPLEDRTGQRIGTLAVSQLLQPDEFAVEEERTRALVVGLSTMMFVLTLILGVVFAARIFDPVRNLIDGTRRIAGGDLAFRLRARGGDEIGELERSFNDMASRLQTARAALDERRRYLEAVLRNIASGVVTTDERGCITAANAAALRILRSSASELEGRMCADLERAAGDSGTRSFWSHVRDGGDGEFETTMLRGSARLTLRVVVTDMHHADEAGAETLGRVAIFEDVTELIRSKKLAAWAEMARQVAHEIKNPLTPLKASAQFMEQAYRDQSEEFPQIFGEGMETIVRQVDVLRRIASEFSGFGRIQKLDPKPLDLGELLQRVTAPYRSVPGLELELTDGAGNGFPGAGVRVLGDEEGLRKVFTNIFENAREAMSGAGRIRLSVRQAPEGQVAVLVADEGKGLAEEARARLFEPYFSTKSTGTGLGLAITRSILEELGGSISLSNRPGGGAEVRVTLVAC